MNSLDLLKVCTAPFHQRREKNEKGKEKLQKKNIKALLTDLCCLSHLLQRLSAGGS